jgi:hypothetical protein
MSYNFQPLSDEELDAINVIEEGIYDFEVVKAERKTSKSGNPMAAIQLRVWDTQSAVHFIYDYLVFSSVPLNIRKVKHFCDSVGLAEEYKKGELPEDLEMRAGKVHIGIEEEKPNPSGGMYPRKNKVVDYVMTDKDAVKPNLSVNADDFDDKDLPF